MPSEGEKWAKWGLKLGIGIAASLVLGPIPAIVTGAATMGTAKVVQEVVDDEDAKEFFGFVADCGKDIAIGGVTGGVFDAVGGAVGSKLIEGAAGTAARNTDKVVGKVAGQWAAEEIAKGGSKAAYSTFARELTKVTAERTGSIVTSFGSEVGKFGAGTVEKLIFSGLIPANEARIHVEHVERGISYKWGCKVCEA